jgi:hypothetical protein
VGYHLVRIVFATIRNVLQIHGKRCSILKGQVLSSTSCCYFRLSSSFVPRGLHRYSCCCSSSTDAAIACRHPRIGPSRRCVLPSRAGGRDWPAPHSVGRSIDIMTKSFSDGGGFIVGDLKSGMVLSPWIYYRKICTNITYVIM